MKKTLKKMTAVAAGLVAMTFAAVAQDSGALVDALVKKGILSDQEAEEIRADLTKEFAQTSAGKLNLSSAVSQLKLYGDARVRYTTESALSKGGNQNSGINREMLRYRLRLGGEYTFVDNFKGGVAVTTGTSNDSGNSTFGSGGDGAFGKSATSDALVVDLAYLQYDPVMFDPSVKTSLFVGRHKKTFELDWINFDNDINVEGAGEKIAWTANNALTLGYNGGQYLYKDTANQGTANSNSTRHDTWLLANQIFAEYKVNKDLSFKVSPMMMDMVNQPSTDSGVTGASTTVAGYGSILFVPLEAKFKLWNTQIRPYYIYSHNFESEEALLAAQGLRRDNVTVDRNNADQSDSHTFGLEVGELKKKKDWQIGLYYIHREAFSSNNDLVDSDWALQRSNMKGYAAKAGYMFTDNVSLNLSYLFGDTLQDNIFPNNVVANSTTANNTNQIADRSNVEVLQVDLNWKF